MAKMLNEVLGHEQPSWERNVRILFGLSVPLPKPSDQDHLELLCGPAGSEIRSEAVVDAERQFSGKIVSGEQRKVLVNIEGNLNAIEMAPGAGKTFLVEALAIMFSNASLTNALLVITEQNVNMCSEVYDRLQAILPDTCPAVRLGFIRETEEDGWTVAWEQAVSNALAPQLHVLGQLSLFIAAALSAFEESPLDELLRESVRALLAMHRELLLSMYPLEAAAAKKKRCRPKSLFARRTSLLR